MFKKVSWSHDVRFENYLMFLWLINAGFFTSSFLPDKHIYSGNGAMKQEVVTWVYLNHLAPNLTCFFEVSTWKQEVSLVWQLSFELHHKVVSTSYTGPKHSTLLVVLICCIFPKHLGENPSFINRWGSADAEFWHPGTESQNNHTCMQSKCYIDQASLFFPRNMPACLAGQIFLIMRRGHGYHVVMWRLEIE